MSVLLAGLATAAASAQAFGGIANSVMQWQQNHWQRNMQDTAWDREDNSIQRRVADLKAAGLSPVLAAGQGASSSNPINIMAPQIDTNSFGNANRTIGEVAQLNLSLLQQKAQIEQTNAQTSAIKQQQDKTAMEMAFMASNNPLQLDLTRANLDFNRAINPQNVRKAILENQSLGIANANSLLDNKLKTIGISQAKQDFLLSQIKEVSENLHLTQQQQEIAAKQIAIDLATNELDNARWDTNWYHKSNLPRGFNLGQLGGPIMAGLSGLDAIENYLKRR